MVAAFVVFAIENLDEIQKLHTSAIMRKALAVTQ